MYSYKNSIPDKGSFDVIVVGAGSSGATAAIAAARQGAKSLLIERLPFLGGTSTAVLDTFYGFYIPGSDPKKIVGGIADDVIKELQTYDMAFERPNTYGAGTGITYHPEYLKVVWEKLTAKAGCKVLLNAWVHDVLTGGSKISGLVVGTKAGLSVFRSDVVIDTTGDADICHMADLPYELAGEIDPAQTLTTTFKMVNVDVDRRTDVSKDRVHQLMHDAAESGKYDLPRREGSDHITPVDHMTATIMTRLKSYKKENGKTINVTDPDFWTEAEIKGRLQALEYVRFLKDHVPGYEDAELSTFSVQLGIRETRRIYGEYRLNAEDVLTARKFDDQVGLCGAPMEDHHEGSDTKWQYLPEGKCVGIPYRTLIPEKSQNVLVAGRCFSANHDAHSSVRSMAQCMVMGQAAGTAAALAVEQSERPINVDAEELQHILKQNNAILDENV